MKTVYDGKWRDDKNVLLYAPLGWWRDIGSESGRRWARQVYHVYCRVSHVVYTGWIALGLLSDVGRRSAVYRGKQLARMRNTGRNEGERWECGVTRGIRACLHN